MGYSEGDPKLYLRQHFNLNKNKERLRSDD